MKGKKKIKESKPCHITKKNQNISGSKYEITM